MKPMRGVLRHFFYLLSFYIGSKGILRIWRFFFNGDQVLKPSSVFYDVLFSFLFNLRSKGYSLGGVFYEVFCFRRFSGFCGLWFLQLFTPLLKWDCQMWQKNINSKRLLPTSPGNVQFTNYIFLKPRETRSGG